MMVDFKKMTPEEIVNRKDNYLHKLNELELYIAKCINTNDAEARACASSIYAELKNTIREEAKYLDKIVNDISEMSKEHNAYYHGIIEASAYGFTVKTNARVNQEMLNSVEEAIYKIDKYFE
ncbi:hypothetical protein [uncultured Blautia sp.]|uniref:hypothetical protein n=1 Tax=Blautia marasmi TaxID=1917868 RepID=UPI00259A0224|nr:hypothetical protein [uncultured Blautia sp.]